MHARLSFSLSLSSTLKSMQEEMEERIQSVQTRMDKEMDEAAARLRGEEANKLDAAQKEKEVRFETWWWL